MKILILGVLFLLGSALFSIIISLITSNVTVHTLGGVIFGGFYMIGLIEYYFRSMANRG